MKVLAYKRHFLILSLATVALHLSLRALDRISNVDLRVAAIFGLPGALHAISVVMSLTSRTKFSKRVFFVALAAALNLVTPLAGFIAFPLFTVVPVVVRLIPQLRELGDSTPGNSIRFFLVVLSASACGSLAYWFLMRFFWLKSLRYRHFFLTLALCGAATFLAFSVLSILGSTPAYWSSENAKFRDMAVILPNALWWLAFSASLFWSEAEIASHEPTVKPLA